MVSQPIDPVRICILNNQTLESYHVRRFHFFLTEKDPNRIRYSITGHLPQSRLPEQESGFSQ